MTSLVTTVFLATIFFWDVLAVNSQYVKSSFISFGGTVLLPNHCIIRFISCKDGCQECGTCYEKFLNCVINFQGEERVRANATPAPPPKPQNSQVNFQGEERVRVNATPAPSPKPQNPQEQHFEDEDTDGSVIEIQAECLEEFEDCMKRNCTDCSMCYHMLFDCVDRYAESDDSKNLSRFFLPGKDWSPFMGFQTPYQNRPLVVLLTNPENPSSPEPYVVFENPFPQPDNSAQQPHSSPVEPENPPPQPDHLPHPQNPEEQGRQAYKKCLSKLNDCLSGCRACNGCLSNFKRCALGSV